MKKVLLIALIGIVGIGYYNNQEEADETMREMYEYGRCTYWKVMETKVSLSEVPAKIKCELKGMGIL